ncbi:interferon alpha-inducible 27 2A isoform X2 [Paramuricea clavata]|uniref:Interferon alpha-inducible 27 2A isoform X2 n=1 Tax=Paramuricea clavata TaxID=317549 RepID=A0A7D9HS32_PARCT|nr:interferon alpha-inducible 27 2A isoform X2 [Paramuricea clavata]
MQTAVKDMKGFSRKGFFLLICVSLLLDQNVAWQISPLRCAMAAAGVVVGGPAAVAMVGYGAAGIGAGTFAANMMSWSAIANGGGVAATMGLAGFAKTPAGLALIAVGCIIP